MSEREALIFRAKVAEQAECFEEMVTAMKAVVEINPSLGVEERNLISIGYKNLIGNKRTAWRIVSSLEDKECGSDDPDNMKSMLGWFCSGKFSVIVLVSLGVLVCY